MRLGQDAAAHRGGADPVGVNAAPVVFHHHRQEVAVGAGRDDHPAPAGLAGPLALIGGLDAVIDAVAQEVHERVVQRQQHGLVDSRIGAPHLAGELLALLARQVHGGSRESPQDAGEGHEPRLGHPLRQPLHLSAHRGDRVGVAPQEPEAVGPEQVEVPLDSVRLALARLATLRSCEAFGEAVPAREQRLDLARPVHGLGAVDEQIARQRRDLVEPVDVDADALGRPVASKLHPRHLRLDGPLARCAHQAPDLAGELGGPRPAVGRLVEERGHGLAGTSQGTGPLPRVAGREDREQVLAGVGELRHASEAHHARLPLERVQLSGDL